MKNFERRFGSWAIPNLTLYLLAMQAIGVVLLLGKYSTDDALVLKGASVLSGEWWRLLSFMMMPSVDVSGRMFMLWLFFAFYIFYMMGSALEEQWGAFRYNLYILLGYLFTVAAAFIAPGAEISNVFFLGGVLLAFTTFHPNFELRLFLVFPVKVKWLGWLTAALYVLTLLGGDIGSRLCVVAAFANYALFFGKDFLRNVKAGQRRQAYVSKQATVAAQALHICAECGVSDKTDETMHFRYCSTCGKCFCEEHIGNHDHG